MGIIDKYQFEALSRAGCSNSDYRLQRTTCCGAYCVEDEELSELYLDSADLSKRVSLLQERSDTSPFPCPLCGATSWNLDEVRELADVPNEWRWACHRM